MFKWKQITGFPCRWKTLVISVLPHFFSEEMMKRVLLENVWHFTKRIHCKSIDLILKDRVKYLHWINQDFFFLDFISLGNSPLVEKYRERKQLLDFHVRSGTKELFPELLTLLNTWMKKKKTSFYRRMPLWLAKKKTYWRMWWDYCFPLQSFPYILLFNSEYSLCFMFPPYKKKKKRREINL